MCIDRGPGRDPGTEQPTPPCPPCAEHSHSRPRQAAGTGAQGSGHVWVTHGNLSWGLVSSSSWGAASASPDRSPSAFLPWSPSCGAVAWARHPRGSSRAGSWGRPRPPRSCVHGAGVHLWPARLRRAWPRVCGRCPAVCHPRGPAFPFHTSSPLRWHHQRVAAAPQRPVRGRCCLTGTAGPAGGNTCPVDSGLRGPHADTVLSVMGAPCLGRSQASHWPALSSPGRL